MSAIFAHCIEKCSIIDICYISITILKETLSSCSIFSSALSVLGSRNVIENIGYNHIALFPPAYNVSFPPLYYIEIIKPIIFIMLSLPSKFFKIHFPYFFAPTASLEKSPLFPIFLETAVCKFSPFIKYSKGNIF